MIINNPFFTGDDHPDIHVLEDRFVQGGVTLRFIWVYRLISNAPLDADETGEIETSPFAFTVCMEAYAPQTGPVEIYMPLMYLSNTLAFKALSKVLNETFKRVQLWRVAGKNNVE